MNLELPTSLLTAHGQLSPSSSLTPEVTIIRYSPPRAPVVRRLRRQNAVIEGVTTSRGTRRPPSPATSSVQMEVDVPEKDLQSLQKLSRKLNYEEEMEVAAEEEEDSLDTDVSMQEMETAKDDIHHPVTPVLMAVKALSGLLNEAVDRSCTGCRLNYPSQKDPEDCMWLEWPDRVDKYIDEAITKLTEERYFRFINMVYLVNEMFEEELDACVEETTIFFFTTN